MAEAQPSGMIHQDINLKHQSPCLSTMLSSESGSVSDSRYTRQKLNDIFTIFASGAALISDGTMGISHCLDKHYREEKDLG
jgi:hypothetical protein